MSVTKKFIQEKYVLNELFDRKQSLMNRIVSRVGSGLGSAEKFLGNNANTIGMATTLGLPGVIIGGAMGAASFIRQKMLEFKWRRQGCDREVDPNRKAQCEVRERNRLIANLSKERSSCRKTKDPNICIQKIDEKINMLRQQNTEAYE